MMGTELKSETWTDSAAPVAPGFSEMADADGVLDVSDDVIEIDLEKEDGKEVFKDKCQCIFTWRLENFSRACLENGNEIYSPLFSVDANAKVKWFLYLFLSKQPEHEGCAAVSLSQMTLNNVFVGAKVSCTISLLNKQMNTVKSKSDTAAFDSFQGFTVDPFLTAQELAVDGAKIFPKGTLHIKCHLCMYGDNYSETFTNSETLNNLPNSMHLRNLSNDLKQLLVSGEFSDANLVVSGETVRVHKIILASRSSLFKDAYEAEYITLNDVDSDVMKALLTYIYSGTVSHIPPAASLKLYEAAERFDIQGLKRCLVPHKIFAKTTMKVENYSFTWYLENFSDSNKYPGKVFTSKKFHSGLTNLHWYLSLKLDAASEDEVVGIFLHSVGSNEVCKSVHMEFKISLLNKEDRQCYTQKREHCFQGEDSCGFQSFIKKKVLLDDKSILFADMLTIVCEMKISDGSYSSTIERSFSVANSNINMPNDLKTLSDTFRNLYLNKTKSDVIICSAQNKTFSLHKPIICARSPVFANFFKTVKERVRPLAIDIKGISTQVLELLFEFIYSGVIEDMTCETALSLYNAANHYKLSDLKVICSDYLKSHITVANVCDVLAESRSLVDEELQQAAEDFICSNAEEIMTSPQWKAFLEAHKPMAAIVLSKLTDGYRRAKKMRFS